MDELGKLTKLKIGSTYRSPACTRCGCSATGKVVGWSDFSGERVRWDPPDRTCECDCHAAWRMMNRPTPKPARPHLQSVAS